MKRKIEEIEDPEEFNKVAKIEEEWNEDTLFKDATVICSYRVGNIDNLKLNCDLLSFDTTQVTKALLKSMIQKSVRTADQKCLLQSLLLYLKYIFKGRNSNDKIQEREAKIYKTNIINRIKIAMQEDVGCFSASINTFVNKHLLNLASGYERNDIEECIKAVYCISKYLGSESLERSRELSHVRAVFKQAYLRNKKAPNEKGTDIENFKKHYLKKNDLCFYYLFKIVGEKKERVETSVLDELFGIICYANYDNADELKLLKQWYKDIKNEESSLFIINAVLIAIRKPKDDIQQYKLDKGWRDEVKKVMEDEIMLKPIFFDKHVQEAGIYKCDKSLTYFGKVASVVHNEAPQTNQEYKKVYIQFKEDDDKNKRF